jgi:hypothetical protein
MNEGEPLAAGLTLVVSALFGPRAGIELLPFRRPRRIEACHTRMIHRRRPPLHQSLRRWFIRPLHTEGSARPLTALGTPSPNTYWRPGGDLTHRTARDSS